MERAPSSPAPADTRAEVEVHSKPSGSKFAPCFSAGGWGGGNLAACPLWKGSSCLRRNSSHSFAVKKVLTCLGAFAEQVKTSQRQLLSAGRKWPVFSSPRLGSRSGSLGKAVSGGSYFVCHKQLHQDALMLVAFTCCRGDAPTTAEKLMVPHRTVGEYRRVSWQLRPGCLARHWCPGPACGAF